MTTPTPRPPRPVEPPNRLYRTDWLGVTYPVPGDTTSWRETVKTALIGAAGGILAWLCLVGWLMLG